VAKRTNLQTDLLENLSDFTKRIEKLAPEFAKKKLIISTELATRALKEDRGVRKTPVTWPLWDYKMFYIVDVPAKTTVPKHSHDEAVFRILISGSLTVNRVHIDEPGTWWVVPEFTEYEITTETGYKLLSSYVSHCTTGRQQALRDRKGAPRS